MIRPEAKAQLWRWREVLSGGAALALGVLLLLRGGLLLSLPGAALALGGAALIWIGLQRGRFRGAGQGPGAVSVVEGQVTYFGPLTGGTVALRDVTEIALDARHTPTHWRLQQDDADALMIPVNAAGVEALFDAFATLPGFRMEPALRAVRVRGGGQIVVWRRDPASSGPQAQRLTRH